MKILIYEDSKFNGLFPLCMMRGVFDIRIGVNSIKDRIEFIAGKKFETGLLCRKYIANYLKEIHLTKINQISKDEYLLLNGRVIFTKDSLSFLLSAREKDLLYIFNNEIIAARISNNNSELLNSSLINSPESLISDDIFNKLNLTKITLKEDFKVTVLKYPWEVIDYILHDGLTDDLGYIKTDSKKYIKQGKKENFINHKKIFISKKAVINPGVVLDASDGKIIIDENVFIEPFTFIKGPAYIGKNSLLKSGTKIYGPCVIGEYSKVAGEIAESVFHSFVNKQHDGFIGHSYICPFVNLGADTVTSDLKNNYSKLKIDFNKNGKEIETGMQLLGSIIGDHSKTSINTMLNTGTIIGIFANIFGGGFPPKIIDSFSWLETGKIPDTGKVRYDLLKATETAKIVMKRRNVETSLSYEELMKFYY
ncbi:MAG TPA: putative sugar nucleotidyl transferase [Ignavibacteria bacterium]|nr:putative sugar nucleotidyl transferase [Ignavibacteria bacterium]